MAAAAFPAAAAAAAVADDAVAAVPTAEPLALRATAPPTEPGAAVAVAAADGLAVAALAPTAAESCAAASLVACTCAGVGACACACACAPAARCCALAPALVRAYRVALMRGVNAWRHCGRAVGATPVCADIGFARFGPPICTSVWGCGCGCGCDSASASASASALRSASFSRYNRRFRAHCVLSRSTPQLNAQCITRNKHFAERFALFCVAQCLIRAVVLLFRPH